MNSSSVEKIVLLEEYNDFIIKNKILGMNLENQDIAKAADQIVKIFSFLKPV